MRALDDAFPYRSQRPLLCAPNVVATSQPLAAQAGLQMLYAGGNAVDAALAAAIATTVVEPTGSGVGSDAFAIVWDGQQAHGLNASGPSPQAWTYDRFSHLEQMPARGWGSVTVPGAVAAWRQLWERFGKLPFERLFEPAIHYARCGFMVSPKVAAVWQSIAPKYEGQAGFRDTFMPSGKSPASAEHFTNIPLSHTLEKIASSGGRAFYEGELAELMLQHSAQHGGCMQPSDLSGYTPSWCGTLSQRSAGVDVHEIPPNSQGLATLIALGILEHFDLSAYAPDSIEALHLQIEAMKLAFADIQAYVGDPDTMHLTAKQMLSPPYLKQRAALVDIAYAGEFAAGAPEQGGTVYVAAADANGMMVSFIQSNYEGFGSGIVVPGTGISLQNRGMGFNLIAGHPNCVGPGKKPFHTIIPGFSMNADGTPDMVFGVMGGPMQAQGHLQLVLRTHVYGQNPQAAIDAPRWQVKQGRQLMLESGMSPEIIQGLAARGHEILDNPPNAAFAFGGAQIIQRGPHGYMAGSDARKDGLAVGF